MPRRNNTPKHQPYKDTNTCRSKRKFPNEEQAKSTAELLELQNNQSFTTYKCDRCGGWHLTKESSRADAS